MANITVSSLLPAQRSFSLMRGKTFVGIDFGTSTTVVSVASYSEDNELIHTKALRLKQMLPDGAVHSSEIVPTVIAWLNTPGRILVGEGASELKYKLKKGKNIWFSFKMELGEDLGAKYYESELRDVEPFFIKNPSDAARVFFAYLKFLILSYCQENGLSTDIAYSVSIPASFEANQRKDLIDALMANDMNVSKQALIDEPNAAFISYAVSKASEGNPMFVHPDYNSKVLVFDFGGGTCDISILEIGSSANGVFSKNIAISKFTQLGGDDIDRYITYHYLMPRFLEANGKRKEQFRTNERKQIAAALYKVAERLKIQINKSLALLTDNFVLPLVKDSDKKTEINTDVTIITNKGELRQSRFYLTNKELTETMTVFLKQGYCKTTRIKGEDEYHSIFDPIDNAIKKSHTTKEEIDYVLFIGGSSQSPYIQSAIHQYLGEDSEMLVPVNLQTHVSQGAAIHSLLLNGMNKCLIQPISSEPILIITKDLQPKVLIPAGTMIPCDTVTISDLVTSREGQKVVELPLCVGNKEKLLFNLKIESPSPNGFPIDTPITITIEVNADKMLIACAQCMGQVCHVEPLSPFANKELSTDERVALKAERQANLEAEQNGGVPSKESLRKLREAYSKIGNDFKAAETFELENELYPNVGNLNNIGVLYHNSGDRAKAAEFFEQAIESNPNNANAHFNLANTVRDIDPEKHRIHMRKALDLDSNNPLALYENGMLDKREGKTEEGSRKIRKAFDILVRRWKTGSLFDSEYGWLTSIARELEENKTAHEVAASKPKRTAEDYYNPDNLSITKMEKLPKAL